MMKHRNHKYGSSGRQSFKNHVHSCLCPFRPSVPVHLSLSSLFSLASGQKKVAKGNRGVVWHEFSVMTRDSHPHFCNFTLKETPGNLPLPPPPILPRCLVIALPRQGSPLSMAKWTWFFRALIFPLYASPKGNTLLSWPSNSDLTKPQGTCVSCIGDAPNSFDRFSASLQSKLFSNTRHTIG